MSDELPRDETLEKGAAPARRGRRSRADARAAQEGGTRFSPPAVVNGGRSGPLSPADLDRMHAAVIEILETVGLSEAPPAVIDLVVRHGGRLAADGRLLFPADLVGRALDALPRRVVLHGRRPGLELDLSDRRVHLGSGGAAPFMIDLETGAYRPSTLRDLYDCARLVDALEHVHFFSRSVVARDMPTTALLDVNTTFACLAGTAKHVCVSASAPEQVADIARMCFAVGGSEAAFRARPFLSLNINHVVPPLRFSEEACGVILAAAEFGIPVHINTFGQLGASSPVTIAGAVVQTTAETLAGMIVAWLANPQVQAIFGPRPMVTDLRSGAMTGGSGEQALLTAASIQMAQYYGLPNSTIAGASDAKTADAQSGYEKALTVARAAEAGCNFVTQACGMQASLMGCSFESYVVDNDMLGAILRSLQPIEVGPATLSAAMIGEVVRGEGHFLGHADTLARMETDFLYPRIADRRTPAEWAAAGSLDIRAVARQRAREILAQHFPAHLDAAVLSALRGAFDIRLSAEEMAPQ